MHITQKEIPQIMERTVRFNTVPLIQGAPGIGKTQMIRRWCEDNGFALLVELLSTSDPMMFRGLQGIDTTGDEPVTVDCVPAIIKKVRDIGERTGKPVVLFLDELTLAPPSMQGAALTFIQDREINGVKLPESTRIVAAGNSSDDSSAVYDLTGPAQNRVVHYYMKPTFDEWKKWMFDTGGHPLLIGALETNDDFFYTEKAADATGPFPSPRQWHRVSDLLNHIDETGDNRTSALNVATVYGLVGPEAGGAIISTIDLADGIPSPEEILRNPSGCLLPDSSDRKRMYLSMALAQSILARCDEKERKPVSAAVMEYATRMPESFIIAFMMSLANTASLNWVYGAQPKYVAKYAKHFGDLSRDD